MAAGHFRSLSVPLGGRVCKDVLVGDLPQADPETELGGRALSVEDDPTKPGWVTHIDLCPLRRC